MVDQVSKKQGEQHRLLSAAQVAERLGVSLGTVRSWGRGGRLTRVVLSKKCTRYTAASVEALVAMGTAAAQGATLA